MITARMIGTGKPKTSARIANQAVLRTAIPNSGSARTRWKFSRPTKVGSDDEIGLLDAHHERADDREPREQPEDDEERQQEHERAEAVAVEPERASRRTVRSVARGDLDHRTHVPIRSVPWIGAAPSRMEADAGPGGAGGPT